MPFTLTPANIDTLGSHGLGPVTAGEAISVGELIAIDADGLAYRSDAAHATRYLVVGMAAGSAAAGQPLTYIASGVVDVGSTFTGQKAGRAFYAVASPNQGKLGPQTDLSDGDHAVIVGVAVDVATLRMLVVDTGALWGTL